MLAVSTIASVKVALPLMNEAVVLDIEPTKSPFHRGSNQSAEKSKREKTSTKRRIWNDDEHCKASEGSRVLTEQYTQAPDNR